MEMQELEKWLFWIGLMADSFFNSLEIFLFRNRAHRLDLGGVY